LHPDGGFCVGEGYFLGAALLVAGLPLMARVRRWSPCKSFTPGQKSNVVVVTVNPAFAASELISLFFGGVETETGTAMDAQFFF